MSLERNIGRRRRLAWTALYWERLWPALWPAVAVAGLFLALALMDALPGLPGWLHAAALAGFALGGAACLWFGLRRLRQPGEDEAQRRLERDSGLEHRPIAAIQDRIAGGDAATEGLWRAHQERMRRAVRRLRVAPPRPDLARRDRYALRAVVFLALAVGLAAGVGDASGRLARAVSPDFSGAPPVPTELDVWVNPPAYTGAPPLRLPPAGSAEAIAVPQGSVVLARLFGGEGEPALLIDAAAHPFKRVDRLNHELKQPLEGGRRLAVRQDGREVAVWPIEIVPDRPPAVAIAEPPTTTPRGAMRLDFAASDDYGLAGVKAEFRLVEGAEGEVVELELPLPALRAREASETSYHDLTPHPWAGLEVRLKLVARDELGQAGESEEITLTLPERQFRHPVARAVIEQRRKLAQKPDERRPVTLALSAITLLPDMFEHDTVAYLGLRFAISRLNADKSRAAVPPVIDLLWDVALRIEDGGLSLVERELRDAQQALQEALARGAEDEEIERLMDRLQEAMNRYMQALAEEAMKRAERGERPQQPPPGTRMVEQQDLQRMLDRARELSRLGARDAAREMLQQLQEMLERLQSGPMTAQPQQGGQQQGGEKAMRELNDMMRQQQRLLDRTFRQTSRGMGQPLRPESGQRGQRGQQGQQGQGGEQGDSLEGLAGDQEELRRRLGELMRQLGEQGGEIPGGLGRAEREMSGARDELGQGEAGRATDAQGRALEQLAQGLRDLAQQMARQPGGEPGGEADFSEGEYDPLGRPQPNAGFDNSRVKIPEEADMQRAREILDELRRRAGDRLRRDVERDYIDRLLRQF